MVLSDPLDDTEFTDVVEPLGLDGTSEFRLRRSELEEVVRLAATGMTTLLFFRLARENFGAELSPKSSAPLTPEVGESGLDCAGTASAHRPDARVGKFGRDDPTMVARLSGLTGEAGGDWRPKPSDLSKSR